MLWEFFPHTGNTSNTTPYHLLEEDMLIKDWVFPFLSPIISYHHYLKFNHLLTYCVLIYVMWKRLHDYCFLYLYFCLHVHGSFTIPSSSNTISCHHCLTPNLPSFTFLPLLLHKYRYFCLWKFINVYFQNQWFCVAVSVVNWKKKTMLVWKCFLFFF